MTLAPLEHEVVVGCSVEHAFHTFTNRMSTWWPTDHRLTGDARSTITVAPEVGGEVREHSDDGESSLWAVVTRWEPPSRLSWTWLAGQGPGLATDVDITFTAADTKTVVRVVHGGWEDLDERAAAAREQNQRGWQALITSYAAAIERSG